MSNINKIIEEQKEEFDKQINSLKEEIGEIPENTCPNIDKLIKEHSKIIEGISYIERNKNRYEKPEEVINDLPSYYWDNVESIAEKLRKDNEKLREIGKFWYENYKEFFDWHINSIKQLLDTLIEEKKGKKKEMPDALFQEEFDSMELYNSLYNDCLDEDITNLTNIKNNI